MMILPRPTRHGFLMAPRRGFTKMNMAALVLCLFSFVAMVGVGVYYKKTQRRLKVRMAEAMKQQEKIYFWDRVEVPAMEINGIVGQAMAVVNAYFRAPNVADKASVVSNGFDYIGKMNAYYADRPFEAELELKNPEFRRLGMLKVNGADCLLIVLGSKGKKTWEFSFFKDAEGIWKLDWPAFVRYQEMDWNEFVHGQDSLTPGSEFRVWAMRDKGEEDKDHYAVRFIGPSVNGRDRQGATTSPVLIEKSSDLGKEFFRYYRIHELQNPGYRILNGDDDPSYMRLRVILSKEEVPGQQRRKISLKKIISEGWYGDAPN